MLREIAHRPAAPRPAVATPAVAEAGQIHRPDQRWRFADVPVSVPRLRADAFSVVPPQRKRRPDKSFLPRQGKQDASLSKGGFTTRTDATGGGADVRLEASTASTTAGRFFKGLGIGALAGAGLAGVGLAIAGAAGAVLTGGLVAGLMLGGAALGGLIGGIAGAATGRYRFTQTIDTNDPNGGTTSPYVDPRPNDDTKPFYYTDSEEDTWSGTFTDHPGRDKPATGTTNWDATCSITYVDGKSVSILDSLRYGFSVSSTGTVTGREPKAAGDSDVGAHVATLGSEFPDWAFTR